VRNVAALEQNRAGIRVIKPADHINDRGFAGAIGSDDGKNLTLLNLEAHVLIGLDATEALRDVLNTQYCI
jgi:hypothetical protein